MKKLLLTGLMSATLILTGCQSAPKNTKVTTPEKLNVVTTTSMIADTARIVGGEKITVTALVGPGVDPHLFKPTITHVKQMESADIIFYNGIELEARMSDALVSMARNGKKTFPVTEDIDVSRLREPEEFEGKYDPHFWHSIPLWIESVQKIQKELSSIDPNNKEVYAKNAKTYIDQLETLDKKVAAEIEKIPTASRVLITAHDAFGYFGDRYDIEVRGVVGISTEDQASAKAIDELANFITQKNIKAIFVENIDSGEGIKALQAAVQAKGGTVVIGGELLSDSLAAPGETGDSYISMVNHNLTTLVKALQ